MRSSRPRRRIPLLLPLRLLRMFAQRLFHYLILVHSVAHRQDRRTSSRRRTVPHKLILPHARKAHPKVNLLPDSLVKVLRAVHRYNRLTKLLEGSSVLGTHLSIIYSTFPCYLLL